MRAIAVHAPRWVLVAGAAVILVVANLAIGMGAAVGERTLLLALLLGLLPPLLLVFGALVESHRALLAWTAFALNLTGLPGVTDRLPLPFGPAIFPTDVLLLLAVGAWLASRLSGMEPQGAARWSPIFGFPLALVFVTVAIGVYIGHERYGASIVGQPLRIALYAGIALALTDLTPAAAWRAITIVFYSGAGIQFLWALYFLATGTSQTQSQLLSTGGLRVLALSVAIYLTGSLVCALLNLELETRPGRQLVHLVVACLALFGIVVSFGRTSYAAVVLIVPLLLLTRRYLRRTVLLLVPLFIPLLLAGALLVPTVKPDFYSTVQARLAGTSTDDTAVAWRTRALESALAGVRKEWLTGVGFGRTTQFELNRQVITLRGDPHNSYAYLLAGGGVLALGSFLLLCGIYLLDSLRRLRRTSGEEQALVAWALATWGAFMINAATGPILSDPTMLMAIWVLFALPSLVAIKTAR